MGLYNAPSYAITTTGTSTGTIVTASITSISILAANANRHGATITNASTANLYLDFSSSVSTSAYAVKVTAGGYYELPFSYTGQISGIWDAANGSALARELTT